MDSNRKRGQGSWRILAPAEEEEEEKEEEEELIWAIGSIVK
jgi:hypothetical protein